MKQFLIFILILVSGSLSAQTSVEFSKENFQGNLEELSKAKTAIRKGDIHLDNKRYEFAHKNFLIASIVNPKNAELNYKLGVCSYHLNIDKSGLDYFQNAINLFEKPDNHLRYLFARALQYNGNFEKAKTEFISLKKNISNTDITITEQEFFKHIKECEAGKQLAETKDIKRHSVNLGTPVNGKFNDYGSFFTSNGGQLFFTSARNSSNDGEKDDDIFYTEFKDSTWSEVKNIGKPVNTIQNEAIIGLSPDGQKLYFYAEVNNGDIFQSSKSTEGWTIPTRFARELTSEELETSPCFSADGKNLFFISSREGTIGKNDIFMSNIQQDSTWGTPINLGKNINTPHNEQGLFLDADTLFFASEGHNSMGGFDIFKIHKTSDGNWTSPENLGFPTNSPYDDFFYTKSGDNVYISSGRSGGNGGSDIYSVELIVKNELIATAEVLEPMPDSVMRVAPQIVYLNNITFKVNKHTSSTVYKELDILVNFLKQNPGAKVSVIGYTDSQGKENYNSSLSKKRAAFVSNYLISKGVAETSFSTKGAGEANPIAKNKNDKGKYNWDALQYNRRVEFVVEKQGVKSQLSVKQIEIPAKFQLKSVKKVVIYSIWLKTYKEKAEISRIGLAGIKEKQNSAGNFDYYIGEYKTEAEANNQLEILKLQFPGAFVFINDSY